MQIVDFSTSYYSLLVVSSELCFESKSLHILPVVDPCLLHPSLQIAENEDGSDNSLCEYA